LGRARFPEGYHVFHVLDNDGRRDIRGRAMPDLLGTAYRPSVGAAILKRVFNGTPEGSTFIEMGLERSDDPADEAYWQRCFSKVEIDTGGRKLEAHIEGPTWLPGVEVGLTVGEGVGHPSAVLSFFIPSRHSNEDRSILAFGFLDEGKTTLYRQNEAQVRGAMFGDANTLPYMPAGPAEDRLVRAVLNDTLSLFSMEPGGFLDARQSGINIYQKMINWHKTVDVMRDVVSLG
jgi:hypothetical protein